jgi:putative spermidine/putrescine transport system permease protein
MFRSRARAFGLALPLLAFIIVVFVYPILDFLRQSVYDARFATLMPATSEAMADWDGSTAPTEQMAAALVADLVVAKKEKTIGKVATRVNRELSGTRSLFTKTARNAKKMKPPYMEALIKKDKDWADIETWHAMKTASRIFTPAYIAAALDRKMLADGSIVQQSEERRIHVQLFRADNGNFLFGHDILLDPRLSHCLSDGLPAAAHLELAVDLGAFAILDVAAGAHHRLDRHASSSRGDE